MLDTILDEELIQAAQSIEDGAGDVEDGWDVFYERGYEEYLSMPAAEQQEDGQPRVRITRKKERKTTGGTTRDIYMYRMHGFFPARVRS